ncbi:MAG: site-specific integrase [Nitrospirae bacterium]|nr:site-specific integrase [Nitrospirota bacterium]
MLPALVNKKALAQVFSKNLPKYFPADEARMILSDRLRQEDYDSYFLSLFLWNTGARVSEALSVRVDDIDLIGKVLRVTTLKRQGHVRVIPLQNGFIGEIALWINVQGIKKGDKLFSFKRKTAYNYVKRGCDLAGITDKRSHPHTWRHSFAVNCITQQVPVTVLKEWLGHRDITKTLIYTQILAHDTKVFMDNIQF